MDNDSLDSLYENNQEGINIKKYLIKGLTYWYLFIIFIPASYIIAHFLNKFSIPTYGLHATVMVKEESKEEDIAGGLQLFRGRENLQTQKGILTSYSLSLKVVNELDFGVSYYKDEKFRSNFEIYKNTPFIVNFDSTYSQYNNIAVYIIPKSQTSYKLIIDNFEIEKELKFGQQFIYKNFSFNITLKDIKNIDNDVFKSKYFFIKNNKRNIVNEYLSRLDVEVSPEKSSILWLWLIGTVPQKDADYLNKLIEVYIRQGLDAKNAKATSIIKFIDEQLNDVSDSLNRSESNLQIFKQRTKTMDISEEGSLLLTDLNSSNALLKLQKNKLNYYQYLKKEIERTDSSTMLAAPTVVDIIDPVLLNYLEKYTDAVTEQEILSVNIINENEIPISKAANIKIYKIRKRIYAHSIKNIEVAKKQIQISKREIAIINKKINNLPVNERRIINIQRKFTINDDIYTILLKRRMEAAITQASNKADKIALDIARAEDANKKSPDTRGNQQKALILGFILPIIIIVALEFLNNKIQDKSEIESGTTIPIIGTIGHNDKNTGLPIFEHRKSPISESFRSLRTNLQYLLKDPSQKVITVTSSISGEGKSFISTNLSGVLAISEKKTLLIGLDLRKPKLQQDFEYYTEKGISTYLIGKNSFEEIIKKTEFGNLYIALSGPIPPNPAELIESEKMIEFLEQAKKEFDYIVIDTPPVAIVTDALLLTKLSDTYVYVMRQNYTNKNVLKLINDLKKASNIESLSIVLNDIIFKKGLGYSNGYGYGYGYGYGQGYYDDDIQTKKSLKNKIKNIFKK